MVKSNTAILVDDNDPIKEDLTVDHLSEEESDSVFKQDPKFRKVKRNNQSRSANVTSDIEENNNNLTPVSRRRVGFRYMTNASPTRKLVKNAQYSC